MTEPRLRWRLIVDEAGAGGAANMALDHALAETLAPGSAVLRLYAWEAPTVSFGRNEPARGLYDVAAAGGRGVRFVRRPTGGRALLHAREVTYAVVVPHRALGGPRATFGIVHEGLVRGLRELGVPAEVARSGAVLPPGAGPCFQAAVPGEVTVAGRKLVGSAQCRIGKVLLQHGSVLLSGGQELLADLRGDGESAPHTASVAGTIGTASWAGVAEAVARGLRVALGGCWEQGGYDADVEAAALRLQGERYATDAWTWRR